MENAPRLLAMKLSLIIGATTLSEVTRWADSQIETNDDPPPYQLIELSLAKDIPAAISLLSSLAANNNQQRALRLHFRHLLRALDEGHLKPHDVARWLYTLALEGWAEESDSLSPMHYLDDYFDHPGLGDTVTEEQANRYVREFLEEHAYSSQSDRTSA
jgi:hypothetical protein